MPTGRLSNAETAQVLRTIVVAASVRALEWLNAILAGMTERDTAAPAELGHVFHSVLSGYDASRWLCDRLLAGRCHICWAALRFAPATRRRNKPGRGLAIEFQH